MSDRSRMWRKRFISYPRRRIRGLFRGLRRLLRPPDYGSLRKQVARMAENQRRLFGVLYSDQLPEADQRATLRRREFQALTESGEAGILLYLFSRIGTTNRRSIEFGIGDVRKCNTTNLVLSFGWSGLLIDGSSSCVEEARAFFSDPMRACSGEMKCVDAWLTPETINPVFTENGFEGEIDLLSLDIDGNDYWIWQAIDVISPRVAVVEYNSSLGPDDSLTVKYEPMFSRYTHHPLGWHHGASLTALERLGRKKGYVLIGCESMGHNAFFVRSDVAASVFDALTPKEAFYPNARRLPDASEEAQRESLRDLPHEWVE